MNLFKFERYRTAFAALFAEKRKSVPGWSTALLAEKIGVQPSHLTNVIKDRNHFSSDQIQAISAELKLNEEEAGYLDLLMEWERAEFPTRKVRLLENIQILRDKKLRAEQQIKSQPLSLGSLAQEQYYLDPNFELLHSYLGTKNAPVEIEEISRAWQLSAEYVSEIIEFLKKNGLVEIKRGRWVIKPIQQHLPTSSPLCKPNQMLTRLRILETLQKISPASVYAFSGTLTMTEDTKLFVQGRFVEFLKEIESAVLASEPENMYHVQFDLFPWVAPKRKR